MDTKARGVLRNAFPAEKKVLFQRCIFFMCLLRNFRRLINKRFSFYLQVQGIEEAENTVQLAGFFHIILVFLMLEIIRTREVHPPRPSPSQDWNLSCTSIQRGFKNYVFSVNKKNPTTKTRVYIYIYNIIFLYTHTHICVISKIVNEKLYPAEKPDLADPGVSLSLCALCQHRRAASKPFILHYCSYKPLWLLDDLQ